MIRMPLVGYRYSSRSERPDRSQGRVPARGDRAEPEATDKARRAGIPHADGRLNHAPKPQSQEPNKPNPPGHRAAAEKKTSPPVAPEIQATAKIEVFNILSQEEIDAAS